MERAVSGVDLEIASTKSENGISPPVAGVFGVPLTLLIELTFY